MSFGRWTPNSGHDSSGCQAAKPFLQNVPSKVSDSRQIFDGKGGFFSSAAQVGDGSPVNRVVSIRGGYGMTRMGWNGLLLGIQRIGPIITLEAPILRWYG